jgi:hypothetical protein
MCATVPFTHTDQAPKSDTAISSISTIPLDPYEQKMVEVRMPPERVGTPGIVARQGVVSTGSASVAHGYFSSVPRTTKLLISNPTSETTVIHSGCRVGSIIPIHLNSDDSMTVRAVFMDNDQSWLDFLDLCNDDLTNAPPIAAIRLAAPDENTHTPLWRLHSDEYPNEDISAEQPKHLGDFVLGAAIGGPNKPYVFSLANDLGRANSNWKSHFHHIDATDATPPTHRELRTSSPPTSKCIS